jgi:effector-binding domain-containing protein
MRQKLPCGELTPVARPYEGLGGAWHRFRGWMEANGHKTASDLYECYVVGPESSLDPANWRTKLSRPMIE